MRPAPGLPPHGPEANGSWWPRNRRRGPGRWPGGCDLPGPAPAGRPPGVRCGGTARRWRCGWGVQSPGPRGWWSPVVGDADGGDLRRVHPGLGQHFHHHAVLGGPDFHGVVLHPALPGVVLGEFLLGCAHNVLLPVKEDGAGAGGALIQGQKIGSHRCSSCVNSTGCGKNGR